MGSCNCGKSSQGKLYDQLIEECPMELREFKEN
jgi:hypothetical protein